MNPKMAHYVRLVEFLGRALGKQYEVVLQSMQSQSIVAIVNGEVSGRSIGAPLTDFMLQMYMQEEWKTKDYKINYEGRTKNNKTLRSSTYFIKDKDELLGMLCINIDINKYTQLSEEILALGGMTDYIEHEENLPKHIENFPENIAEAVNNLIVNMLGSNDKLLMNRLTQEEKLTIVEQLKNQGIFLLKGAVSEVAQQLHSSEASIYRYLGKISGNKK